jgi:hypothetical protein
LPTDRDFETVSFDVVAAGAFEGPAVQPEHVGLVAAADLLGSDG